EKADKNKQTKLMINYQRRSFMTNYPRPRAAWGAALVAALLMLCAATPAAAPPNAKVTATSIETGLVRTIQTDETGLYRLALLPPGSYKLTAGAQGFA